MKYLLQIFLYSLLVSCQGTQANKTNSKPKIELTHELKSIGKIEVEVDSSTRNWTQRMEIVENEGREILIYENTFNKQLQLYDLGSAKLLKSIAVEQDGPTGVKCLHGFYYHSIDSIYAFCNRNYEMYLLNNEGKVLETYNWANDESINSKLSRIRLMAGNMAVPNNDKSSIFVPVIFSGGYDTRNAFKEYPVLQKIDFNAKKSTFFGHLSQTYYDNNFNHLNTKSWFTAMPNGNFLFGFQADDYLYELDVNTNSFVASYYAGSHIFDSPVPIPVPHESTTTDDMDQYLVKSSSYLSIQYDKYRNVYYRAVLGTNEEEITKREFHKKPLSIIILDENLQKIGETKLKNDRYMYRNILISKKGLLVSISNPMNPENNEDIITFEVFSVNKS